MTSAPSLIGVRVLVVVPAAFLALVPVLALVLGSALYAPAPSRIWAATTRSSSAKQTTR